MNRMNRSIISGLKVIISSLFSRGCLSVWQRNFDVWRKRYAASLTGNLGEPILFLIGMGFGLGKLVAPIKGLSYIEFIAPGLVCSATMYSASFECTFATYTKIAVQKTYDAIRVTPVSVEEITCGDILWGATKGMIAGGVFLFVMLCFGLVNSWWVLLLPFLMVILAITFASLAILFASKAPAYDFFSYYFTLVISPMFLFSGIFFPVSQFPPIVEKLAWFTPLVHFVDLSRGLVLGNVGIWMLADLAWIVIFALIILSMAISGVKKRVVT